MNILITRVILLLDADRLTCGRGVLQERAGALASATGRRAKRDRLASAGLRPVPQSYPARGPGLRLSGASAPRVIAELYVLSMLVLLVGLLGLSAAATGVFH